MAGFGLVVASASAPKEAKVVGGENALQVASRSRWSDGLRIFPVGLVTCLPSALGCLMTILTSGWTCGIRRENGKTVAGARLTAGSSLDMHVGTPNVFLC